MAGTWKFYWDAVHTIAGVAKSAFGFSSPVKEVTTTGRRRAWRVKLPKKAGSPQVGVPVKVWDYTQEATFSKMLFQIVGGSGVAYIGWVADRFVAGVPEAGSNRRPGYKVLSCDAPEIITVNNQLINSDNAIATGINTDGSPKILNNSGTAATGQFESVWLTNDSTTADIEVDVWIEV
jgi:hypothetical protein